MTYDANHRLLTMTDANGHTFVRNVYDANNRVSEQYDALNNKWTFAYDEPAPQDAGHRPAQLRHHLPVRWRLAADQREGCAELHRGLRL